MTAELGHFAIALALALSIVLSTLPMIGSFVRGTAGARLMASAQPAAHLQFAMALLSFGCLMALFVTNDFTVLLVATHSNLSLPVHYR
ncbi:MAG TPA: c-type cytochrome biogenesis protein CcmF, partial [Burkholderiaceae bacterium]|nr:c-type cytochrome biogenesis protein CcmF [Burkholderiaceae bacterium]